IIPFIEIKVDTRPVNDHGTHVAGIIGANKVEEPEGKGVSAEGMCPDIKLYDFRVLSEDLESMEFGVIAALEFIRYLNSMSRTTRIHGANLSLSIPHDVRDYACGRTPVCDECERLVESGVVVVAAAGNRGYQSFTTKEGAFDSYAALSITDPGNAESVITVGSTHRTSPHTYGVSFFSSRGPTGD
ncbi:MAG: peptidase S8, partial [Mesorhizobium sp.]